MLREGMWSWGRAKNREAERVQPLRVPLFPSLELSVFLHADPFGRQPSSCLGLENAGWAGVAARGFKEHREQKNLPLYGPDGEILDSWAKLLV
jgi:hypothetical protein